MPFGETTNSTVNAKERGCGDVFKKIKIFFLLKFNIIYMFWIVLMC